LHEKSTHTIGPCGEILTFDNLPSPDTLRWSVRRKAEVVSAIRGGFLTFDEACSRYGLTMEELTGWQRAVGRSGMHGLRATRMQEYRDKYEKQDRYS
jgi:hypothetical protein